MVHGDWVTFLKEHDFLVGLSLDGTQGIHNDNRKNAKGKGTHESVLKTSEALEAATVAFNILSVVTSRSAKQIDKRYHFFTK